MINFHHHQPGFSIGDVEKWIKRYHPDKYNKHPLVGIDEVGRGALAGPLVLGAVNLNLELAEKEGWLSEINDSKKLSPAKREKLDKHIRRTAHSFATTSIDSNLIDTLGLAKCLSCATEMVANKDWARVKPEPILLLDGYLKLPLDSTYEYINIPKGDQRSYHIAAASIIAKVHRDWIMTLIDRNYPEYGFAQHKGYGTKFHRDKINELGICKEHRKSFKGCK